MENLTMRLENLAVCASGIDGAVWFEVGERSFPEENWQDLVSDDLIRWVPDILSFAQGHTDLCVLRFMDGPCALRITRAQDGTVKVCGLWDQKTELPETEFDFRCFLDSVGKCVRRVNRFRHEHGMPSQFEKELSIIRNLRRA